MEQVLIMGGGVAGLAAAAALKAAGVHIILIEARDRVGGRLFSVPAGSDSVPVELGAEFIHGTRGGVWDLLKQRGLHAKEVPDRHWTASSGRLFEHPEFWSELQRALPNDGDANTDQSFAQFLHGSNRLSDFVRKLAVDYVEGFHAADLERMGVKALAKAEAAGNRSEATRTFRIMEGYDAIVRHLYQSVGKEAVQLATKANVIEWGAGHVVVRAEDPGGRRVFEAARVLVTVPLGVLKRSGAGALNFVPELPNDKRAAIAGLEMGVVRKISLQFGRRFWPEANFGFLHAPGESFPVWWTTDRGDFLTAWLGGPRARALNGRDPGDLVKVALSTLARLFRAPQAELQSLLVGAWTHDWNSDEFSEGAYSYTPVGMIEMPQVLGSPVDSKLFFAGEATNAEGEQGTVQAALSSGRRTAAEILKTL